MALQPESRSSVFTARGRAIRLKDGPLARHPRFGSGRALRPVSSGPGSAAGWSNRRRSGVTGLPSRGTVATAPDPSPRPFVITPMPHPVFSAIIAAGFYGLDRTARQSPRAEAKARRSAACALLAPGAQGTAARGPGEQVLGLCSGERRLCRPAPGYRL